MADVFVSYSRKNRDRVAPLAGAIEEGAVTVTFITGSSRCGWAAASASDIPIRPAVRNAISELSTL